MDAYQEQIIRLKAEAAAAELKANPKPKIITPMDFRDKFAKLIPAGAPYSMSTFTKALNGYVLGETTLVFAKSGCGKTAYIHGECLSLIADHGCPVACVSTEETEITLTNNIIWIAAGRKLTRLAGDNRKENASIEKARWEIIETIFGNRMLWMPEDVQSLKLDSILAFIEQCAVDHGIKHFFIDSVTSLAGKSAASGIEPWQMLEKTVTAIADIGRRLNLSITLIGHCSVEKQNISQYSIKGSSSLATFCDNVLSMYPAERPVETDSNGLTTVDYRVMEILKVRVNGEYRNKRIGMAYDMSKRRLRECPDVLDFEPEDRTNPPAKVKPSTKVTKVSLRDQKYKNASESVMPEDTGDF